MKKLSILALITTLYSASFAQTDQQVRNRIDGTNRNAAIETGSNNGSTPSYAGSATDAGAQRPVVLSKTGISSFFGYDTKYFYRSNQQTNPRLRSSLSLLFRGFL